MRLKYQHEADRSQRLAADLEESRRLIQERDQLAREWESTIESVNRRIEDLQIENEKYKRDLGRVSEENKHLKSDASSQASVNDLLQQ